jgi:hypothetical protein
MGTSNKLADCIRDRTADTTLNILDEWKKTAEQETGKKLKRVRTNNAPEFRSTLWADWFRITHEFTAAYSSASNSGAERGIGVILSSTRVLLLESGLGSKWWSYAFVTSAYVQNFFPSSHHPGQIPEEKWTGKRQNVDHLRVWGCVAYIHIPAQTGRSKLDPRGIKCRFIGYEGRGAKIFKVDGSE